MEEIDDVAEIPNVPDEHVWSLIVLSRCSGGCSNREPTLHGPIECHQAQP